MDFPYKQISDSQAINDYNLLKNTTDDDTLLKTYRGSKILHKHFECEKVKTVVQNCTQLQIWDKRRPHIYDLARKFKKTDNPSISQLNAIINFKIPVTLFRPGFAKYIYNKFKPKTVLDFSAGWGGRLLGALSLDIDYIGVDSNINLQPIYKELINKINSNSVVKMIWSPAENVDYSQLKYDLIFTSPPFYTKEIYENMPSYTSLDDWMDNFLVKVVSTSYMYLDSPGTMCLHLPLNIYSLLAIKFRPADYTLQYNVKNRDFKDTAAKSELIYCWTKS